MEKIVGVPYEDFTKLQKDSADKASVVKLLGTEFPDNTCQIIAIKSVLGIDEQADESETDPGTTDGETSNEP